MFAKIFRELMTGIDGQSHDLGRYSWLGSFILIAAVAIWHEFRGIAVDLTILAAALGGNAAAHAASLFVKASTEPKPPEEPKS